MHESELFRSIQEQISGFQWESDFSGNFRRIAEHIADYRPDAVIFSHADAAVHLRKNYLMSNGSKPPLLIGYGYPVKQTEVDLLDAAYISDGAEMGRQAVELLLNMDMYKRTPLYRHAGGNIIEFVVNS